MTIEREAFGHKLDIQQELLGKKEAFQEIEKEKLINHFSNVIDITSLSDPLNCKKLKISLMKKCMELSPGSSKQFVDLSKDFTTDMIAIVEERKAPKVNRVSEMTPEQDILSRKARLAEYSYLDIDKKGDEFIIKAENINSEMYGRLCEFAYDIDSGDMGRKFAQILLGGQEDENLRNEEKALLQCVRNSLDIRNNIVVSIEPIGIGEVMTISQLESAINLKIGQVGNLAKKIISGIKNGTEKTIDGAIDVANKSAWMLDNLGSKAVDSLLGIFKDGKKEIQESGKEFLGKYNIIGEPISDTSTGFQAMLVQEKGAKEKTLLIRGTDELIDITGSDLQLGKGFLPDQLKPLIKFFEKIKGQFPGEKFNIVGHSLGGALAQLLTAIYKKDFVSDVHTFNAPGILELSSEFKDKDIKLEELIISKLKEYNPVGDYSFVFNTVNSDEIGNHGPHLGTTSEKLPGKLHFMRSMRENIESMKPEEFKKYFEKFINKRNEEKQEFKIY